MSTRQQVFKTVAAAGFDNAAAASGSGMLEVSCENIQQSTGYTTINWALT